MTFSDRDSLSENLAWVSMSIISAASWLWLAMSYSGPIYTLAKSHFTVTKLGGVNAWALVSGAIWAAWVFWLGKDDFFYSIREVANTLIAICFIALVLPVIGATLMISMPLNFNSSARIILSLFVLFIEIPISCTISNNFIVNLRDGCKLLSAAKTLTFSLVSLSLTKAVFLAILPGVHIRL